MHTRLSKILEIMAQKKRAAVTELAETLEVSEVTVRKDLSQLEAKGLLKREHGYALLTESDDIGNRLSIHYDIKRRIAQEAANSVSDGETVMIESGSTCALLAEALITQRKDITIITNSVFIATFVRDKPNARIILLGGDYQVDSQVMVGPLVRKCAEEFFVGKFFVGTDGFSDVGVMSSNLMRAEAVRSMAKSAKQIIVLTESEKFSQLGVVTLLPYQDIDAVYTDDKVPKEMKDKLEQKGIHVHAAAQDSCS